MLYHQELSAHVEQVSDNRTHFILNKGLGDGIEVGDFARFFSHGKFAFKAVAILSNSFESEWVIFYLLLIFFLG